MRDDEATTVLIGMTINANIFFPFWEVGDVILEKVFFIGSLKKAAFLLDDESLELFAHIVTMIR